MNEVTDEMVDESFRRLRETEDARIKQEGFFEGKKAGYQCCIDRIKSCIEHVQNYHNYWKALDFNMRRFSQTKKINILKELVEDLEEMKE